MRCAAAKTVESKTSSSNADDELVHQVPDVHTVETVESKSSGSDADRNAESLQEESASDPGAGTLAQLRRQARCGSSACPLVAEYIDWWENSKRVGEHLSSLSLSRLTQSDSALLGPC